MKNNITAIVLTKDEEKNIENCLNSLSWCSEILIIDDYSADRTITVINGIKKKEQFRNTPIKIFRRNLENDFSAQRNYGASKSIYDWLLFIDADEIVTPYLKNEIKAKLNNNAFNHKGYFIKRRDFFLGRELKYGETANVKLLRLARKNAGKWKGNVHEIWHIDGTRETLVYPLYHHPHENISGFLTKINRYSSLVAQHWIKEGRNINFWEIILYPKMKFINNYVLRLGFLDDVPGFIMAAMMSFHSFLVRGKVILAQNK